MSRAKQNRAASMAARAESLLDMLDTANVAGEVASIHSIQAQRAEAADAGSVVAQRLVPLESLHPSPWQPRTTVTEEQVLETEESLRKNGLLQPLPVRPHPTTPGGYELLGGHVRLEAIRRLAQAGENARGTLGQEVGDGKPRTLVPVSVRLDASDDDACLFAIVENSARTGLAPSEAAVAFFRLQERERAAGRPFDSRTLGLLVSRDHNTVARHIRVGKLLENQALLREAGLLRPGEGTMHSSTLARLAQLKLAPLAGVARHKTLTAQARALRELLGVSTEGAAGEGASGTPEHAGRERPFVRLGALRRLPAERALQTLESEVLPAIRALSVRVAFGTGELRASLATVADRLAAEAEAVRGIARQRHAAASEGESGR